MIDEKGLEADAYLRALLDYSSGFYAAAIDHGMKPGPAADAVQHIERAARNLHRLAIAGNLSARSAEPVAWRRMNPQGTQSTGVTDVAGYAEKWRAEGDDVRPLYAAIRKEAPDV